MGQVVNAISSKKANANLEVSDTDDDAAILKDCYVAILSQNKGGVVKDQNGTKYYITKNSWGADSNKSGGYLNMSESYVRAKTICVMVHKDSLPKELKKKLGIQ